MFDSHRHLPTLGPAAGLALDQAQSIGVEGAALCGFDPSDWAGLLDLAQRTPHLSVALGLHPWWVAAAQPAAVATALAALDLALHRSPRGTCVGELGLDHSRPRSTHAAQLEAARAQLGLARLHGRPVVLHVVRAHGPMLALLRRHGLPNAGGLVHGWGGPPELVQPYLDLGLHLSFGGALCKPGHRRAKDSLVRVPGPRLLLETDDQPGLGLPTVVQAAAQLRQESPSELAGYTAANAQRLFFPPISE